MKINNYLKNNFQLFLFLKFDNLKIIFKTINYT
jgi:hypothetical protein